MLWQFDCHYSQYGSISFKNKPFTTGTSTATTFVTTSGDAISTTGDATSTTGDAATGDATALELLLSL